MMAVEDVGTHETPASPTILANGCCVVQVAPPSVVTHTGAEAMSVDEPVALVEAAKVSTGELTDARDMPDIRDMRDVPLESGRLLK